MRRAMLACNLVLGLPALAFGQVQDRPARPEEGVFGGGRAADPSRLRHELTLTTSVLGGYDEIVQPGVVDPSGAVRPRITGSTGLLDTNLQYGLIKSTRSFEVSGRGYLTAYESSSALLGGELRASASTSVNRRARISGSQTVRNSPYLALGEFGQLSSAVGPGVLPDSDPTLGLAGQRSWMSSTSGAFNWNLTTRQMLGAGGDYSQTTFSEQGAGFDSRSQGANADYNWQFSRVAGLHGGYRLARTEFEQNSQHMSNHQFNGGFTYSKRLSRTKQISFAADGGAAFVETVSPTTDTLRGYWTPAASGSVGVDIGRSWSTSVDYNRSATVLDRVSVQTFYSNALSVRAGGLIGRRVDLTFTVGLTRGREATTQDGSGRYESYNAATQLRIALARCCATLVSYSYYDYSLHDIVVVGGLPTENRNQGVRVGFTVWAPLHRQRGAANPPTR